MHDDHVAVENGGKKQDVRGKFITVRRDEEGSRSAMYRVGASTKVENERSEIVDCEKGLNYSLRYTRCLLGILGVWPYVALKSSLRDKLMAFLLFLISISFMIMSDVPLLCRILLRPTSVRIFTRLIGTISVRTTNILNLLMIFGRRDSIKNFLRHMEADWRMMNEPDDRSVMLRNSRTGLDLTVTCMICMYSGGLFVQIMPLATPKRMIAMNISVRPSVPGIDMFVDPYAGHNYEIIYYGSCLATFFLYSTVSAICNLAALFASHARGQIEIIVTRIKNLVDKEENIDVIVAETRLAFIIKTHSRVIAFISGIDELLRDILLLEVATSTLIICLLAYYCLEEWKNRAIVAIITYVLLLLNASFNILIFCSIGELIKEQCTEVGRAAYMIDWYRLPGKTGLDLIMIMATANYPRKLTAGRMMELSIDSFSTIIRTSFAYLNLLRTMTDL